MRNWRETGKMSEETMENIKISDLESLKSYLISQDNWKNHTYVSEIPQMCKDEPCLVGIDEAGRGPVLGPMVYGIAYCPIAKKDVLVDLGCADSKQLTEEKRDAIFEEAHKKEAAVENVGWAVEVISPNVISTSMYRRTKTSLNEISMDSAIGLIHRLINAGVNIAEIYVDTVGPPEKYQDKLLKLFPYFQITVAKKADSTYPIVSMASICAKVTRDHALKVWKFPEGLDVTQEAFGSGYPGDPLTKKFLAENIDPVFGYPRLVRFSWATAESALHGKAFDVVFEEEDEADKNLTYNGGTQITNFFKGQTKDGKIKRIKHSFFKERFIESVTDF